MLSACRIEEKGQSILAVQYGGESYLVLLRVT